MKRIFLCHIFNSSLTSNISRYFPQEYYDNTPTLSVSLTSDSPFVFQDSEGYTVVVGMVENKNSLTAVTNARDPS